MPKGVASATIDIKDNSKLDLQGTNTELYHFPQYPKIIFVPHSWSTHRGKNTIGLEGSQLITMVQKSVIQWNNFSHS